MKRFVCWMALCLCLACLAPVAVGEGASDGAGTPLPQFLAEGAPSPDLSRAASLCVVANHCEYGEPMQTIRDVQIVRQVADALNAMTVTGLSDTVSSTGTYFAYALYDVDGATLLSASFQDGLLLGKDGRYAVTGLDALTSVEGVLLLGGWDDYWEAVSDREAEYERNFKPKYPESIFAVRGAAACELRPEEVIGVNISVSWVEEADRLNTNDPALIAQIMSALQAMQATGPAPEDGDGLSYTVTLYYMEPEGRFVRSVWFGFEGDRLECDTGVYALSGLDALFAIEGVDTLAYLRDHYMENRRR